MPKTPHSSRGPSRWSFMVGAMASLHPRLAVGLDPFPQARVACVTQFGKWDLEQSVDRQGIAADLADHYKWRQRLARARDDERPPRRLAKRIKADRQQHRRTETGGDAALGEGDRDPALGDVVGTVERPRPHARPD